MSTKEIYEIGEVPPVGQVPQYMYGQLIRANRFGEPKHAFQIEKVAVPDIKPDETLVYVMAAGINFNNAWAALGSPVNVIAARQKANYDQSDFHIGGSDASGIVYAVGRDVKNVKVGDHVVIHCGVWDRDCPAVKAGEDPMFDPSYKIWGYETNWGSFAQFTKVQGHQCMPKAKHLTWEEAAAPTLVGATALLQLAVFLLDAATLAVVLAAIGSDGTNLPGVFASFMIASVAATVGPTPLGLGTFETVCVATLALVGVRLEAALTATLLLRGLTFWLPMLPGLWIARRELRQDHGARPPTPSHETTAQ